MKEKPILMSAPMVRATVREEAPKTQTRREIKGIREISGCTVFPENIHQGTYSTSHLKCPYGAVGGHLWVRETWYCDHTDVQVGPYKEVDGAKELLYYRADGDSFEGFAGERHRPRWRPGIHLPRWACRIILEILNVRVERLHDISEDDCLAEGIEFGDEVVAVKCYGGAPIEETAVRYYSPVDDESYETAFDAFRALWCSINGVESWESNPWVWALTFKRVKR